jgi:type VI secretion system secreted protein VgrG
VNTSAFVIGTFESAALPSDHIAILGIDGYEQLSQLYEFRVTITKSGEPLTQAMLAELLLGPCSIRWGEGTAIHGIAREVHTSNVLGKGWATYDIVLVPTVWVLTASKLCRLYQGMSTKDIAKDILDRYGLQGHYELRIGDAQPRELCIQYDETDWDFLQRWFEHEGYFYWFEHSDDAGEKLIVADANSRTSPIAGKPTLPFRERAGMERGEESVFEWRDVHKRIPARIILKDYNDQKPLMPMVGRADVDASSGFGVVFEYGDNFDTPMAGDALAKKRAERFLTERLTLQGATDSVRYHVGHSFQLGEHPDPEQNRKYLITSIRHRIEPLPTTGPSEDRDAGGYRADFTAIPFDVQFRPLRKIPWPSIHGLMHGHIDSDSPGTFSTLDEQGRYRVRFPFDSTNKKGEQCSTWVRMAQHYAGSAYGSHFPLHRGTEVILAFLDGDPDRPVIVGSLANTVTPSPSNSVNATQSVIKTASGIQIIMDDQVSEG